MLNIKKSLEEFTDAIYLCKLIQATDGEVRFIGGAVRDIIANRQVTDIDLATTLLPKEIITILKNNNIEYHARGAEFGTVTAFINNNQIEITTLRADIDCDGRHAKVKFTKDWQVDAQRRDFTINALSADLQGNVYDYCDGLEDLKQNQVKFIGNPEFRIKEDHLRALRFYRFSGFFAKELDPQGLAACLKLKDLTYSVSRLRAEMAKISKAPNLSILKPVFAEEALSSIANLRKLEHIFHTETNELLRLAIFLRNNPKAKKIIKDSAFSSKEQSLLKILLEVKINDYTSLNLKKYWQQYKHNFKDIIFANLSANYSALNKEVESILKHLFAIIIQPMPIRGEDLLKLNIQPGKKMGKILAICEDIWYINEFKINKEDMLKGALKNETLSRNAS